MHNTRHSQIKRKREMELIEKEKNETPTPTSFVSKHSQEVPQRKIQGRSMYVCVLYMHVLVLCMRAHSLKIWMFCACMCICTCIYLSMYACMYMDVMLVPISGLSAHKFSGPRRPSQTIYCVVSSALCSRIHVSSYSKANAYYHVLMLVRDLYMHTLTCIYIYIYIYICRRLRRSSLCLTTDYS